MHPTQISISILPHPILIVSSPINTVIGSNGSKAATELNNQHGGVPIKVSWSW
jgi:hypothetical protein